MTGGVRPTADELAAWRTFLRAHAHLTRRLEAELEAAHGLALPSYEVLLHLAEATEQRMRMTDLADRALLSRSGLTRLVDRLERDGLVCRAACPSDARGTHAVLTPAGLAALRAAAPTHLRGISEHVTDRLSPSELVVLTDLLSRLAGDSG